MKLALFGASGRTGHEALKQILAERHTVTALVRSPEALDVQYPALAVVRGDVLDAGKVAEVVAGADVVLCALGTKPRVKDPVLSKGTGNIVAAMKEHGVQRLVVQNSFMMSGDHDGMGRITRSMARLTEAMFGSMVRDKRQQERIVRGSGLEWVLVRPARLTNGSFTGRYRAAPQPLRRMTKISRADVADFMLRATNDADLVHRTTFLTN